MTISYQRDVASSTAGGFTRLLFKWKGSLYKLICRELILFLVVYALLGVIYRQLMNEPQQKLFESVVRYFDAFLNLIPLSFVLGFYVSYVASRWWQQFLAIPWPDKLFHSIACYIEGFDDESRMLRRSLMRWMNLAMILVLRSISSAVKQRFPTLDHVVEAGFMTVNEKKLFESVPANEFNTYWVPCTWFIFRLQEATKQGRLLNQYALESIMREFCEFRAKCGLLWCYDWVSIPMVYTQVVTLATYLFFIFTLIGRQKIQGYGVRDNGKDVRMASGRIPIDIDLYIPIFTVLQFFFYMGLLKVAEQLINPFGDDDEDFELNWLIDRHVKASFLGCDVLMNPERIPPLVKDYYWDKQDCPIPYTEAAMKFKVKTYKGSADEMKVPEDKCLMVMPEIEEEENLGLSINSLMLESSNLMLNIGLPDLEPTEEDEEEGTLQDEDEANVEEDEVEVEDEEHKLKESARTFLQPKAPSLAHSTNSLGQQPDLEQGEKKEGETVEQTARIQRQAGLHLAEVGAWWDLSTYKWDGVQDQGGRGDGGTVPDSDGTDTSSLRSYSMD